MDPMSDIKRARVGDIELAYETFGRGEDPPVLLVMGLGAQMHYWPDQFCRALTERGLYVVRYDNRDVGLSLIEALDMQSAHLVGMSLGGMIVQLAAIEHPERVRSLVSIASTTGDPSVGAPKAEALAALLAPPGTTREEVVEHAVALSRVIGSPGFERDEQWLRWRAGRAFDRGYDPAGVSRQAATAFTAGDRTQRLGAVHVPTLVVHGSADPLVDVSGAEATAAAIQGAELLVVEGLGHDLPPGVWLRLADAIAATVRRAEDG